MTEPDHIPVVRAVTHSQEVTESQIQLMGRNCHMHLLVLKAYNDCMAVDSEGVLQNVVRDDPDNLRDNSLPGLNSQGNN